VNNEIPASGDILCATRSSTGTLITVPAGRYYSGNVHLSASVAVAGISVPVVTVKGVNAQPGDGTVVCRLNLTGLALTTINDTVETEIILLAPPENAITLDFTAGVAGTSSATVNGFLV